jgi:sigma-B regulation protein RsbU (phosphoserine phosphatase)
VFTHAASHRPRILIVDDEPGMRRAAERVLAADYEVAGASLPSQAMAMVEAFRPDLVICDIRMPEMDGFALVTALRALWSDLDVIFMTGSHTEPDAMLVRAIREQAFYFIQKPFDRQVLSTLVARCLELRWLRRAERAHADRMARELDEARVFQRAMLPEPGVLAGVRIDAECRPCHELGGDLYDFVATADGRLALLIADVRGHGASAALMTAVVKSAFLSVALGEHAGDPLAAVDALAVGMAPFGDDRFVTAICGRFDLKRGELEYVNAGHPPALAWHGDASVSPVRLDSTGPLVSPVFGRGAWEAARITLGAGPRLLLYTDGLMECLGGSPYAAIGVIESAARASPSGGRGLVDALLAASADYLAGRGAPDDVSVVTLKA